MSYDFNAEEIFAMAAQIERNGARFYKDAAAGVSDPESKKLLLDLAGMEEGHEKTFQEMRKQLTAKDRQPTVFDPDGESTLYLKALADTRVFFEKEIDLSSMREILKAAIAAEKDSIVFYLGMKEAVPDNLGKQRIDGIIKEEMYHIRILSKELVALK
ncbi:MAG: ferritin family protein [Pseudomonadota bacterium]|uniref:Ferritin family protein n=1 Tax=Candidatus Desulfatibia profunda TaxID=2841695 RepID=A0A8J6NK31_9BACT|nr:ferritin family protein [Candidatus Desulfatibia profunda]MBL7181139.1 ferritin family protein [Desulfobacterales bacterium]